MNSEDIKGDSTSRSGEINMAHTAGPWWVNVHNNILSPGGKMVAFPCGSDLPQKANARLIAAAPELLEALKELMLRADNLDHCEGGQGGIAQLEDASLRASLVIAKATGSQP